MTCWAELEIRLHSQCKCRLPHSRYGSPPRQTDSDVHQDDGGDADVAITLVRLLEL